MQIPIINGIYTDNNSDFRVSYPKNLIPIPKQVGASSGYLRPACGIVELGRGPGHDRGGINWNGRYFRVMGTDLIEIFEDGTYTAIGEVTGKTQCTLMYSFDYLAIVSNNQLFLYDGTTLEKVTDTDLGNVIDAIWVDGYFLSTDGEYLVVTELSDPFSVNPLKYGSSELNPDPVVAVKKIHNEVYAVNRYTIEIFTNTGGSNFPFSRVDGAQIDRGAIGTHACTTYMNTLAFLGSGVNERPSVYMGANGASDSISNDEIDKLINQYSEDELKYTLMETRKVDNKEYLYIHLPDYTLVFDASSSTRLGMPVWFKLTSSTSGDSTYRARNFVYCFDKCLAGDPISDKHSYLTNQVSTHFGENVEWEFSTGIVYNEGNNALLHELELVALPGRNTVGSNPTIYTSYSNDGITWSAESPITSGSNGQRDKRLVWRRQGFLSHWRIQKFRGLSDSHLSVARVEAKIEGLTD